MRKWRDRSESEKTTAEKMRLEYCECGHPNTLHAGGVGDCAYLTGTITVDQCKCQWFIPGTQPESKQYVGA
jgi:hypothetical protein